MIEARLLLVDDSAPFVAALRRRLSKRHIKVVTTGTGERALTKLLENPNIDVVILDVKMPGMGGIETLTEIKRICPDVEVIMLTGHATLESAMEGMKRGAFDYLMKPCDIEELVAKIIQARAKRNRSLESSQGPPVR